MTNISDFLSDIDPEKNHNLFRENENRCESYKLDTFISKFKSKNGELSVLTFNVRSYIKNFDEFFILLTQSKLKFDIIVLTETWCNITDAQLCYIEGYQGYHCFRKDKLGGGVSVFVADSMISEPLNLNLCNSNIECLGVSVKLPNSDTINIVGVYRPPMGSKPEFIEILEKIMRDHGLNKTKSLFMGDFNICLAREYDQVSMDSSLANFFQGHYFIPLVTVPTRVTKNSSSIIDHIWSNVTTCSSSGAVTIEVTDHYPTFSV